MWETLEGGQQESRVGRRPCPPALSLRGQGQKETLTVRELQTTFRQRALEALDRSPPVTRLPRGDQEKVS